MPEDYYGQIYTRERYYPIAIPLQQHNLLTLTSSSFKSLCHLQGGWIGVGDLDDQWPGFDGVVSDGVAA